MLHAPSTSHVFIGIHGLLCIDSAHGVGVPKWINRYQDRYEFIVYVLTSIHVHGRCMSIVPRLMHGGTCSESRACVRTAVINKI